MASTSVEIPVDNPVIRDDMVNKGFFLFYFLVFTFFTFMWLVTVKIIIDYVTSFNYNYAN